MLNSSRNRIVPRWATRLAGLCLAFAILWSTAAFSQAGGSGSIPINATIDGMTVPDEDSPIGVGATGRVKSGPLKGSKEAIYLAASLSAGMPGAEPPTVFSYSGVQTFHTPTGDLEMTVLGVSDMNRLTFTELCRITGGTGRFQGATGDLYIFGGYEPDGIAFQGKISGRIVINN
jgi:hypothetical protein